MRATFLSFWACLITRQMSATALDGRTVNVRVAVVFPEFS